MKAVVIDVGRLTSCEPLTSTRPLGACPVANLPLAEAQRRELTWAGFTVGSPASTETACYLRGDAWCSASALSQLMEDEAEATILVSTEGEPLAWTGSPEPCPETARKIPAPEDCFLIRYPWDLLRVHEILVNRLHHDDVRGTLSPAAHVVGHIVLGEDSVILPGVFIEGPVLIGRRSRIGPNAYLRGPTAIGDACRIGHAVEIKTSIVMNGTHIPHLSYCGDAILGERVNLGGGTIVANVRHDGATVRSRVGDCLLDTGRRKFGAVLGDGVHTGIHTSIYPGRKLWPGVTTRPGETVADDIRPAERSSV